MRADSSSEVPRVFHDDDVNADAVDKMRSHEADVADKRGSEPTFRLGKRRSSEGSDGSTGPAVARSPDRRSGTVRRSTTFDLTRRSPYDSLTNYDDDHKMLSAGQDQVDRAAAAGPSADGVYLKTSDGSAHNDFADDWWPVEDHDILVHKKDGQPTFRLGRSDPTFRLGKRDRMRVVEKK